MQCLFATVLFCLFGVSIAFACAFLAWAGYLESSITHQEFRYALAFFFIGISLCAAIVLFLFLHSIWFPLLTVSQKAKAMLSEKQLAQQGADHCFDTLFQPIDRLLTQHIQGTVFSPEKQRARDVLYQQLLANGSSKKGLVQLFEQLPELPDAFIPLRQAILQLLDDLKEEKEKLATSKAKVEAMLLHIGDGLLAVDLEKNVIMINPAAAQMLEVDVEWALGKKWYNVLRAVDELGEHVSLKDRVLTAALERQETIKDSSVSYVKKNGVIFSAAITASPLMIEEELVGGMLIVRDISKEKAIDKAKTEFVSLASHQLRTPLATINWYAEMLFAGDAGKLNEEQRSYLEEIYVGSKRMVELVNALLNVSRIELDTFSVQPRMVDLAQIVDDVLREMAADIKKKSLHIVKQFSDDVPIAKADPDLIQIVFQNIINNAVKYTGADGEVTISLSLYDPEERTEDGPKPMHLLFTVADNGYGIPKGQQKRIFSKMFRADNVKQRDTVGTGLGLYIVKSIVEYFGGKIWFDSEEEQGTTFYIVLPILEIGKRREREY